MSAGIAPSSGRRKSRDARVGLQASGPRIRFPAMMRYVTAVALLALGLAVASGAAPVEVPPPPEQTDWAWEPIGPVAGSGGMTAIATDPSSPRVLWIAGPTSVWVSEDGGATVRLVLQLSRAAGLGRATGSGEELERDAPDPDEEPDPADSEDGDDAFGEGRTARDARRAADEDAEDRADEAFDGTPARESSDAPDGDGDGDGGDAEVAFGITRLRLIGDELWVCTSRGLWSVARAARQMGTGREARLKRRVAVNDVARVGDGALFVAADDGLWQLGAHGLARPVAGFQAGTAVNALAVSGGRVFVGSARGLYVGDGDSFERVALSAGSQDTGIADICIEPQGRVAVADGARVRRLDPTGTINEDTWTLPGTRRLAAGKDGVLWAVGASGAWRFDRDAGWIRAVDGLFDRRLVDVAPSSSEGVRAWVAGRAGAWRLVPETAHVLVGGAGAAMRQALVGRPSADDAIRWADKARGLRLDTVDEWTVQERLSWLLPKVEIFFRARQQRDEDRLFIPSIDLRILDAVEVAPRDTQFRIMARWDVMPIIVAAIEPTRSTYETSRNRARKAQRAIHDRIIPLWESWARKRVDMVTHEPKTVRDAVRDMLQLGQLEADLHALTGGRFPYDEPGKPGKSPSTE
jgi:hypothetical protein